MERCDALLAVFLFGLFCLFFFFQLFARHFAFRATTITSIVLFSRLSSDGLHNFCDDLRQTAVFYFFFHLPLVGRTNYLHPQLKELFLSM